MPTRNLTSCVRTLICLLVLAAASASFAQTNDKPALVLQAGHTSAINSVVVSPDGKLILTASDDLTIKLWDAASGRVIRVLSGHTKTINRALFSPDGKTIFSASEDGTVRIWDVASGRAVRTLDTKESVSGVSLAVSPDGKYVVRSQEKTQIWDVFTGQLLRTLDRRLLSLTFSPDGQMLAAVGFNDKRSVELLNPQTGAVLRELPANTSLSDQSLAFSPDGKLLAIITADNTIDLWDVTKGSVSRSFKDKHYVDLPTTTFSPDGKLLLLSNAPGRDLIKKYLDLYDVRSGSLFKRIDVSAMDSFQANSVSFQPDGKTFLTAGYTNLSQWDVANGTLVRHFELAPDKRAALVVDAPHKTILLGVEQAGAKSWDANFSVQSEFADSDAFDKFYFSPDGRIAATDNKSNPYLRFWRTDTGQMIAQLEESVDLLRFSPDSQAIALLKGNASIEIYDSQAVKLMRTLRGHTGDVVDAQFTPDGKYLVSISADKTARVWDWRTGESLKTLAGLPAAPNALALDNNTIAVICNDANVSVFDVATGKPIRTWSAGKGYGWAMALSPDGRTLATATYETKTRLWDTATGQLQQNLGEIESRNFVDLLAFSPDGNTLISRERESGPTRLWNVKSGQLVREWNSENYGLRVSAAAFTKDGKALLLTTDLQAGASNARDLATRIYASATGELLADVIGFADGSWVVVAPDGLFDGTPASWPKLNWRFGGTTVAPVESFFNEFYYPGLLTEILSGKRPRATRAIAQLDRRQPKVELLYAAKQAHEQAATTRTINLTLTVTESGLTPTQTTGSGAQDLRLFHNGSLVKVWHGDVLKGQSSAILEAQIPIVAGENILTAYAFNRDNIKSADAMLTIDGAESLRRKGTAYVVSIGVNRYAANPFFRNLKFAVADAEEFAAETQRQQEYLAKYEKVEVVKLTDTAATKANALAELTGLAKKVQPEDMVIVYFAGHGLAEAGRFYLIPHDIGIGAAADQSNKQAILDAMLAAHGISDLELEDALEGVDAGLLTLVVDACNSGQALGGENEGRGPMNSKGLAQLAYDKGMYILTAAQSFQAAQEASQVGHGLLTYALVEEGLKQAMADDEPKDGQVDIREWLDYATQRVPQMQAEKMKAARGLGLNLSFKDKERGLDGEQRSGQQPRVFYRRELEAQPTVIAKPNGIRLPQ